jgi:sulfate transport system permease protein
MQAATLVVQQKYQDFEQATAYATAFLLAFAAVTALIVVSLIRPRKGPTQ